MKYTKHILFAGLAAVTFASCNQEAAAPSEADIATKVSEKVEAAKAQLKADCDKNVMDEALRVADSVMVKAANKPARTITKVVNAPAVKTPVKAPVKVKEPVKVPVKVDPVKDKMNGGKGKEKEKLQEVKDKMNGKEVDAEKTMEKVKNKMGGGK